MVSECVRCATGFYGVNWFPTTILVGGAGGAASVSTLGVRSGVCTGGSEGDGAVDLWVITLGAVGVFSLGAGWVLCSGVEYGGDEGLGRKMLRMRVRDSKRLVCIMAGTYLMAHDRKSPPPAYMPLVSNTSKELSAE